MKALLPAWECVRETRRLLKRRYPALGVLPWISDWCSVSRVIAPRDFTIARAVPAWCSLSAALGS